MTNFDIGVIISLVAIFLTTIGLYQRWMTREKRNTSEYYDRLGLVDKSILELKLKYLEFEKDLIELKKDISTIETKTHKNKDNLNFEINKNHLKTIKEINSIKILIAGIKK